MAFGITQTKSIRYTRIQHKNTQNINELAHGSRIEHGQKIVHTTSSSSKNDITKLINLTTQNNSLQNGKPSISVFDSPSQKSFYTLNVEH